MKFNSTLSITHINVKLIKVSANSEVEWKIYESHVMLKLFPLTQTTGIASQQKKKKIINFYGIT